MATVNGSITKIEPDGNAFKVHVSIPTDAMGAVDLSISVEGPIQLAPDQARRTLYALGVELAEKFQYSGNLA